MSPSKDKVVAAFTAPSGEPFYLLFEATEIVRPPMTSCWRCVCIGGIERVIHDIFLAGSGCMPTHAGHEFTPPETYIHEWMVALAQPLHMPDVQIALSVGVHGQPAIHKESYDESIRAFMLESDHDALVEALDTGAEAMVSLHADSALLAGLYEAEGIYVGSLFDFTDISLGAPPVNKLGYAPAPARMIELCTPEFMRVPDSFDQILVKAEDGNWQCQGSALQLLALYVGGLWETELCEPGSYQTRIKAYRQALDRAALVPNQGVRVVADRAKALSKGDHYSIDRTASKLPYEEAGHSLTFQLPNEQEARKWLFRLPLSCTSWIIDEMPDGPAPSAGTNKKRQSRMPADFKGESNYIELS